MKKALLIAGLSFMFISKAGLYLLSLNTSLLFQYILFILATLLVRNIILEILVPEMKKGKA